jgi:hypothetical protein
MITSTRHRQKLVWYYGGINFAPATGHRQLSLCCSSLYITPWSRVIPKKITDPKLIKKFPAFYETRKFIPGFTNAYRLFLSWVR